MNLHSKYFICGGEGVKMIKVLIFFILFNKVICLQRNVRLYFYVSFFYAASSWSNKIFSSHRWKQNCLKTNLLKPYLF